MAHALRTALVLPAALGLLVGCHRPQPAATPGTGGSVPGAGEALPDAVAVRPHPAAWRWADGDRFDAEVTCRTTDVMAAQGRTQESESEARAVLGFALREQRPGGEVTLDLDVVSLTDTAIRGPAKPGLAALAGQRLGVVLDPKLEVVDLRGVDDAARKVAAAQRAVSAADARVVRAAVDAMVRYWLGEVFVYVPAEGAGVGGTWEQQTRLSVEPVGGIVQLKRSTGRGLDTAAGRNVLTAAVAGRLDFRVGSFEGLPLRVTRADLHDVTAEGEVVFDLAAGRLVRSEWRTGYRLEMSFSIQGQHAQGSSLTASRLAVRLTDRTDQPGRPGPGAGPGRPPVRGPG